MREADLGREMLIAPVLIYLQNASSLAIEQGT